MFLEFMGLVLALLIYGIFWTIENERKKKQLNYPPGPIEFPIIGGIIQCLLAAGLTGQLYERAHKVSLKFGKCFTVGVGNLRAILTEDYETAKEVLNSPDFVARFPSHPRFYEHTFGQNIGLMWSGGENNKEMRRFSIKTLKTFGFGELNTTELLMEEELNEFFKLVDDMRFSNSNVVNMYHIFKIPVFNILWRVMAGYRFAPGDKKIEELIHAVDDVASINIGLDPEWAFPSIRFIPGCSPTRAKYNSFATIHYFFIDILHERREKGSYKTTQNDFVDYFLKKIDEEKNVPNTIYTDEQFIVTCMDLLFGGIDTTSNSIEFGILRLLNNPRVLQTIEYELQEIIGNNTVPNATERKSLHYLEAAFYEVLRTCNIVPLNGRTAICDTTIRGYFVPKDTLFAMNTTIIHNDPSIWEEPNEFFPERFLDSENNLINTDKLFGFGAGKRVCIGKTVAKVVWVVFMSGVLQRYKISRLPNTSKISEVPKPGVANSPAPFECILELKK